MRPDSPRWHEVTLKRLVGDVLDRVDQFDEFDPRAHYAPTLKQAELTEAERNTERGTEADTERAPAAGEPAADPDAVSLDMPPDAP